MPKRIGEWSHAGLLDQQVHLRGANEAAEDLLEREGHRP